MNDSTLSRSSDPIQCAVDCADYSDTIMLSSNSTIQPESAIIINKSITISGFHEEVDMSDDTYPAAKKKTVITCPKNTTQGIFNIKSSRVIIANLEIRDCLNPENASPVVIGECNNNTDGVKIHHVDFMNNSGRSHPVAVNTLSGPTSCGALEMTDILFRGNKAGNEAVFVRLQSKTDMKDIRLKNNLPEHVNEQRNRFFLFNSTEKENDSLSINNLDASRNSVPILEARVGIVNILRSVFKKNKVNIEDNEIKWDASMIQFLSTSKVTIRDCLFNDNAGKGQGLILSDNVSSIEIHNSTFSRNSEFGSTIFSTQSEVKIRNNNMLSNTGRLSGGVLHLEDFSNAIITNSTFSENMSDDSGGAVYAVKDSNIIIRKSTFEKNIAREGGCFHIEESNITIIKSIYQNNKAKIDGGAIRLERGGVICRHSTFTHNTASDDGGAFNIENATYVDWTGVRFSNNHATFGSSARIVKCENNVLWKDVDFQNSTVGLTGAAAYIDDSNVTIDGAIFQNLTAPYGGALYAQSFNITIKNALFKNNHAHVMGGAISGEIGTITFKNATFIDNRSMLGGALHFYNSTFIASDISFESNTASEGAGLLFKDSNVSIGPRPDVKGNISVSGAYQSDLSFGIFASKNNGMDSGGVLAAKDTNVNISYGAFVENRAQEGGTIQITSAKGDSFHITNSLFNGSIADVRGGGIAARASDGELSVDLTNVEFKKCISDQGGAIFFTSVNAIVDNCSFVSNTAADGGAAVFQKNRTVLSNGQNFTNRPHTQDVNVLIRDCKFKENKAGTDGGAIRLIGELIADRQYIMSEDISQAFKYADYGFNVTIKSVKFCKNRAYSKGGAIYGKSVNLTIHDVRIKNNNATEGGGVLLVQSNFTVLNSKVIMNQAENGGGGIKVTQESNVTIFSTTISDNQITKEGEGGGLSISGCTVKGQGLYVKGNSATFGGGLNLARFTERDSIVKQHVADSRFLCLNCIFVDNKASTSGGGMNIEYQDTNWTVIAQLEKCSFEDNSADVFGGGIHFSGPDDHIKRENWTANGYLVILNSTFTNNIAGRSGGSLLSYDLNKVLAECTSSMENTQDLNFTNETRLEVLRQNQSGYCPQWNNEENEKNISAVSSYIANCTASMVNNDNDDDNRDGIHTDKEPVYETIPGQRLPSILVNCYDEFGNIFKSDGDGFTATLKSKKESDRQGIFVTNLTDGTGNFTGVRNPANATSFNGPYKYELEISFSLDYVQPTAIEVYVRACRINEQKEIAGVLCKPCDATQYNFKPMIETCKPCDNTLNCSDTFVRPSENYWHASPCHAHAKKCLTTNACERAIDFDKKLNTFGYKNISSALDEYNCNMSDDAIKEYQKLLCKEGYKGVLCGSCNETYGRSLSFACTKCNGAGFSVLILAAVCAWLAAIAAITIRGSMTIEERLSIIKKQLIDLAARNPHPVRESLPEEVTEDVSAKMLKNKKDEEVEDKTIEAGSSTRKCHRRMISGLSRATNSSYWVGRNLPTDTVETTEETPEEINNLNLAQMAKWKLCEVFKVTINFLQAIAIAAVINVEWTRYMLTMFNISAFTGGASTALLTRAIHCFPWWNGTKYATYVGLVSGLLVPIFVVLCIVAFFAFLTYKLSKGVYYFIKRSVLAALAISYFSYLSITKVAVMFFYCVGVPTDDNYSSRKETYYWALDTSIQCSASYHKRLMVFGGMLFALFSVGFPLVLAAILVLFRKPFGEKDPEWMSDILGFLYRAYRRKFVFWESTVMLRKALLSVIAVFSYHLGGHTQGLLASSILSVCLFFQAICKPYRHEFETVNNHESLSLLVSGITFTLAQFFRKDRTDQTVKVSLSVLLMVAIIGFMLYMMVSMAICFYDVMKADLKVIGALADDDKKSWSVVGTWVASRLCFSERPTDDNHDVDVEMGATRIDEVAIDDNVAGCSY